MRKTFAITLGICCFAIPAAGQTELQRQLADEQKQVRQAAYQSISKARLPSALRTIARLRSADIARHSALLRKIQASLSKSTRRRLGSTIKKWHSLRAKAVKLSLDEDLFPNPGPKVTIRGPYKGYSKVMPSINRSRKKFAVILRAAQHCLETLEDVQQTFDSLEQLTDRIAERTTFLQPHRKPSPAFSPTQLPLLRRLDDLARGKFKEALAGLSTLDEPDRTLLFVFYGLQMDVTNKGLESGMGAGPLDGVRRINELRMALGILPLEASPPLTKAITGHLDEMNKLGYWGHYSPNAAHRTVGMRTHQAGWRLASGEGLTSAGPERAAEIWCWDGGHFRIMAHPKWTHIGYATTGRSGINVGIGKTFKIPRPTFFE